MQNVGCAFTFVLSFALKQILLQILQFPSVKRHFTFIHKIDYWLFSLRKIKEHYTLKLIDCSIVTRISLLLYLVYQDEFIRILVENAIFANDLQTHYAELPSVSKTKSPFHVPLTCRRNCDRASRSSKELPLPFPFAKSEECNDEQRCRHGGQQTSGVASQRIVISLTRREPCRYTESLISPA